ncbi:hypothetical protein [Photobacterium sp. OFAV2-7]|uniref:hypothetical protein n=1 Tax=Photobacterium sp. OFAV2-7 TaxID=2917748 RepID=UPI001EF63BE3|nr:hypothetical protein [Photobacterium sp. OFAV2-7]MCG7587624.1 hypothetical protein [Photobacterium sp. OFAV2-7]
MHEVMVASTAEGLLLGNSELVIVTLGEFGAQLDGAIPVVAAAMIDLWDVTRKEKG